MFFATNFAQNTFVHNHLHENLYYSSNTKNVRFPRHFYKKNHC